MALAIKNLTITDEEGNVVSGATVTVRDEATGRLARLFSDRDGTDQISNPFTADEDGHVQFHVQGGAYSILARKDDYERQWRYEPIGTAQEVDVETLAAFLETGTVSFRTKDDLDQFAPEPGQYMLGAVQADPDPSLNGYYTWDAVGEEWEFARPFPETLARLVNINGSANARTADAFANTASGAVTAFFGFIDEANTGPMTLSINGEGARPVVNAAGNPLSSGEFQGGVLFFLNDDGDYQLINDAGAAASAAQSASEAGDSADRAEAAADSVIPGTTMDEAVTRPKLNTALRSIVGFQYATLADLEADTVPTDVSSVRVVERTAGNGGGAFWSRQDSEPDVPALAKTQDAGGAWWKLEPENGTVTPEMFGAQGGFVIENETRALFDEMDTKPNRLHLKLIDKTVKWLKRTELWGKLPEFYMVQHTQQASLLSWTSPGTIALSAVGSVVFNSGVSFGGNGTDSYFTSNTGMSDLTGVGQNDLSLGVYVVSGAPSDVALIGRDSDFDTFIVPCRETDGKMRSRHNQTTTSIDTTAAFASPVGHSVINRTASGTFDSFKFGTYLQTHTSTSAGVPSDEIQIGRLNSNYNGNLIGAAHVGQALERNEIDVLNWIIEQYLLELPAALLVGGDPVEAAELDAALAIDANETTAAMHDFMAMLENGRAKGLLGPTTYVINEPLRARFNVTMTGTRSVSTLRMAGDVNRAYSVIHTGDYDERAENIYLSDFVIDSNYDRNFASGINDRSGGAAGCCLSICYTKHARIRGILAMDPYKHCFDATGVDDNTSGVAGSPNPYIAEMSTDVVIEDCEGWGAGDDIFTTHTCDGVKIIGCRAIWTRGQITAANSNCFEADDYSIDVTFDRCFAMYAHRGFVAQGHTDSEAARKVQFLNCEAYKVSRGIGCRHMGFEAGEFFSTSAKMLTIRNCLIRHPLEKPGQDVLPFQITVYKDVEIDGLTVDQDGAPDDIVGNVGQILWRAGDMDISGLKIKGFNQADKGLWITSSADGKFSIIGPRIEGGPLQAIDLDGSTLKSVVGAILTAPAGSRGAGSGGYGIINQSAGAVKIVGDQVTGFNTNVSNAT